MRKNTSYLDTLNDGRQRRARTSLDDLDRTLRGLEERIGAGSHSVQADARHTRDVADRFRHLASDHQADARKMTDHTAAGRMPSSSSFKTLAQDIEFARVQEKNVAAVEAIAAELKNLRGELQNKMTSSLQREFDALRADIAETYRAAQAGFTTKELSEDIARLSDNIRALAQRSEDSGVNLLRLELEEVKRALGDVAREDTIQQFNKRWDQLDRRWDSMQSASRSGFVDEPEFQALAARLDDISEAVNNLPGSLPLASLEEKLRVLASAIDQLTSNHDPNSTKFIDMIEQRLDEISRAIVASSVSVQAAVPQTEHFDRIEARISSLARQIEELNEGATSADLADRINSLAERMENLARDGAQTGNIDGLSAQIAALAEKMDSGAFGIGSEPKLQELEQRYERLADLLERQHETNEQQGRALLRDLEARLDSVSGSANAYSDGSDHDSIIRTIDARFSQLAQQLDNSFAREPAEETMRSLEERLDEISRRLDASGSNAGTLDTNLIRSLESQIAGLTRHLQRPDSAIPDYEDIGPRLREIESAIAGNREQIMDAAREAAEMAIRSLPSDAGGGPTVRALAEDLKSLENLTKNSDQRNARTFEAIHDTLLKIVDRLGTLETRPVHRSDLAHSDEQVAASRTFAEDRTPPLDPALNEDLPASHRSDQQGRRRQQVSPLQAAEAAAQAALGESGSENTAESSGTRKKSMLGGFTRALKGRVTARDKEADEVAAVDPSDTEETQDAGLIVYDTDDTDKPLEPGSGAPDLGSIMARVSGEGRAPHRSDDIDAAKSDFIAAARRAAQAAAAEAETNRTNSVTGRSRGRFKGLNVLQRNRKPVLIGASVLLIALAGLQLGKAFLKDGGSAVVADVPAVEESVETAEGDAEPVLEEPAKETASDTSEQVRMVEPVANDAMMTPADAAASPKAQMTAEMEPDPVEENTTTVEPAPKVVIAPVPVEAGPVALREAAQAGDAKALYEVANRYAEGRGVESDLKEAARWYQFAADLGFAPAQYRVGNFYEKGLGLERDPAKAMMWYQLAAEQGNASAMHNLAVLHAMGASGQPDNESAARWFLRAAELGVKDSQFNLGILSAKGVGMPQNLEESYKWFALAANSGDKDAASKRDEIANALLPEKLANARAAVELWKAKPIKAEANTVEIPAAWEEDRSKTAAVDMNQAVKNIQLILNKIGYDAGPADGMMGARTKNAIAAFQKDHGMNATGEVDEALVKALLAKNQ